MTNSNQDAGLTYRRGRVLLGPFDEEPYGLRNLVAGKAPDGAGKVPGGAIAWLLAAVEAAGVEVSDHDRVAAPLIFADCGAPGLQVIAGWIARAQVPDSASLSVADGRRATPTRLLDALDAADVAMGSYDHDMTGFLIEDCGPPAARLIARWLREVRPDEGYDDGAERPDPVLTPGLDPARDRVS